MAASIEQKLDFLLKKIGYVASKTGIAEDSTLTGTKKAPFGEAIPSPLVTPATSIWADSIHVPATPPGSDTSYVKVYLSGSSGHQMTMDPTVSGNRTFIARSTYNNNSSAILGDWVDTSYGPDYIVKVYKGDPNSGGVQLSAAGSGSNDTWFFDYSSGVLNFNGTVVPSGVTSSNIYIVGYRYIGAKGAIPPAGIATFSNLYVSGVSTFVGVGTFNSDLYVGGNLEIKGTSTFRGGTINLGDADTDDINIGGEFVSNLIPDVDDTYDLGSPSKQWRNLYINGHTELDNVNVSGITTFANALDINSDIDVDGHTELDNVNIAGVTTFQSNAFFGDADYIQMGDSQDLKIGHVGSYSVILDQGEGNLSIGGDGFVDIMNTALDEYKARFITNGAVELYWDNSKKLETTGYGVTVYDTLRAPQLNITGVSTYEGNADFNANVDIFGTLDVDGHTELDNLNVSGVSTFISNVDINADIDVDGHTNLDNVSIAGVTTFAGNIDADGNLDLLGHLDIDGHTELDNLNVTGVSTFSGNLNLTGDIISNLTITSTDDGSAAAPEFKLFRNSSTPADADYLGQIKFAGESDTGVERNYAKITGKILDASNGTEDGILEFMLRKAGSNNIAARFRSDELQLINDTQISVAGTATFSGPIDANGDLDVDGHTNLDNVSVAGVTTFTGAIDANGDLDVDGHTELDNVNVSGVSTFISSVNINSDIDVDGHTELDNVNVSGVTTTSGLLDINAGGQANTFKVEDLTNDRIVIAGTGGELEDDANLTFNGTQLFVGVDLDVDGHTELDNVNVSGMATVDGLNVTTNFDVYDTQAVFHNDLYVSGNLSIGGTTTVLQAQDLKIFDKDIILGVTTDAQGNDISTDTTANHGGVAVASTTGNPLVNLTIPGLEELPSTYKKIMWFREGAFSGLGTDAWLINYAVGIGSTQFPTGTRLAVGGIQFTEDTIVTPNITISEDLSITGDLDVDGHTNLDNVSITGVTTFASNIDANGDLDVDGHTNLDNVSVTGVTTFTGAIDANGDLDVDGHTELDNVSISGVTTFTGVIDANDNVDVAGTLDVDGHTELDNVNISGVATATEFVGPLTGNVTGTATTATKIATSTGGSETDYYVMLALNAGGDNSVRLDSGIKYNTPTDTLTLGGATVVGAGLSVVGVSTFTGDIDSNGRIVGAATSNVIPFLYSTFEDLPNASTYHGAFAHAHNRGKGYFAHSSNWYELVNKELNGTVGTGTERYNVGQIDATDVDVSGITTSVSLHVGVGGTVITASGIGSVGINSTAPAYALDVVGDINSSTDIKVNGVSIVVSGTPASTDDVVALAIALG